MSPARPHLHIDSLGVVRIGTDRIPIDTIIEAYRKDNSAQAMLHRFPSLTPVELQAALDYHLHEGADGMDRGPHMRDANWRRWNKNLAEEMGTDLPPSE